VFRFAVRSVFPPSLRIPFHQARIASDDAEYSQSAAPRGNVSFVWRIHGFAWAGI